MIDTDKIYLENFLYVSDHLNEVLPLFKGQKVVVNVDYYSDEYDGCDFSISTSTFGELINVRQEFLYALKVQNKLVIDSVMNHLYSYLKAHGVLEVKFNPISL